MEGDFPEVRAALGEVRDLTGVTNTKVALIAFGCSPTTLFGLTDHASTPWDSHIHKLGGNEIPDDQGADACRSAYSSVATFGEASTFAVTMKGLADTTSLAGNFYVAQ